MEDLPKDCMELLLSKGMDYKELPAFYRNRIWEEWQRKKRMDSFRYIVIFMWGLSFVPYLFIFFLLPALFSTIALMVKYPTVDLRIRILGLEGEMHKMKKRMREIEFVDTSSIPAEQFPPSE